MKTAKNATINRKQFQLLADYMPQIVWISSPKGNLEYCNKRWEEYTGISFAQTSAGEWLSIIHVNDRQALLDAWDIALRDQSIYEIEARFKRAHDNEFRWHLIRGFPIKDENGNMVNWFGTSTDIHDVKEIQESFKMEQQRYQTLIQSLQSIYWTVDPIGQVTKPQPSWQEFSGQTFEDCQGFGWLSAVHPDDKEMALTKWNAAIAKKEIYHNIARFWSVKAKAYIYCIARAAPMLDDKGQIIKWIGSCLDIQEHKNTEKQLQEVSEHMTIALESGNAGAWSWEIASDKVVWSKNIYKLFGLDENHVVNKYSDFEQYLHPQDKENVEQEIKKVLEKKLPMLECDYRVIWPDGSIHFITTRAKLLTNNSNDNIKLIGVCLDITERNRLEKLILQHQLEFAKETKISSISEIASTMAHELNQPLAAINTFIQGSIQQLKDKNYDNLLYALKSAETQSKRAGEIIHRIKNSVRKKYLYVESTDLMKIIKESIKFIKYEKNNHEIQVHFDEKTNIPSLLMDKIQIQQVIINLLRNSIEALVQGQPEISINCFITHDNLLKITIKDNGPGFPQEILSGENMGLSTKQDGMGIGLFICQSIINAHGGQLVLRNAPDKGAEVIFTIPVIKEELSCPII